MRVSARVRIESLRGQLLPVLYSPDTVTNCPSFEGPFTGFGFFLDYGFNREMNFKGIREIKTPPSKILFSDYHHYFSTLNIVATEYYRNPVAFRPTVHGAGSNVLFADFHVSWTRYEELDDDWYSFP